MATEPDLLLMDEPFAALDAQTHRIGEDRFLDIWDGEVSRKTVIFVTHDVAEALVLADRVIVINGGGIASDVQLPFTQPRDRREIARDLKAENSTRPCSLGRTRIDADTGGGQD